MSKEEKECCKKGSHEHNHGCGCNSNHDHEHNHECGCHDHDHDDHNHEELEMLELTLDDDTTLKTYVLGIFEVEDKEYIALLPEDDERVLLYSYVETGGEVQLNTIEDDEEFEIVSEAYYELFSEGE